MGRDDAKRVSGLQGGTAPARAFHDFMVRAVARRPVENFEIEVELPEWQVEPDEESWFQAPDNGQMMVDADGNPIAQPESPPPPPDTDGSEPVPQEKLDQDWLDRATGRDRSPPPDQSRRRCRRRPSGRQTRPNPWSDGPWRRSHRRAGLGSVPSRSSTKRWKRGL
jgi:penicillin-binding protein 1A